ncbi:MAG: MarR family winged helix-turn-helix transcriptional regulator [Candidatus Kapaibacteriota bacterium]
MKKTYSTQVNNLSLDAKIVAGFERISEVFRFLLWDKGKSFKLTPIQIQILTFLATHPIYICNVSYLSQEFNITKATISDTVKTLIQRKLIAKKSNPDDQRSFYLSLTNKGKKLFNEICNYQDILVRICEEFEAKEKSEILMFLMKLIYKLVDRGVIKVQRMCFTCRFFSQENGNSFCNFLNAELPATELRLDCPDYISINTNE